MDIVIKKLQTNQDFFEVIELQKIIWRLHDYADCIPNHIMMVVSESGGLVLGAYKQNRLIGFLIVMVGYRRLDGLYHHSHILGVLPDEAYNNIGFRLKKTHREQAISNGIQKVTWTYDPLLGPNANLNIQKLGGIVRKYKSNYYGEVMGESDLVSGIPSDRFWVEWYIQSERVNNKLDGSSKTIAKIEEYEQINDVRDTGDGFQKMIGYHQNFPQSEKIAVAIPFDYQKICDHHKALAVDWRKKTRELFMQCFEHGFTVVDFIHVPQSNKRGNYYLLQKNFLIQ